MSRYIPLRKRSTAVYSYYLLTAERTPYEIAKSWFDFYRAKNMSAALTKCRSHDIHFQYHVWVEFDPRFFNGHVIPEERRHMKLSGVILESCGGFRERLSHTGHLRKRENYDTPLDPKCLESLSKFGGGE